MIISTSGNYTIYRKYYTKIVLIWKAVKARKLAHRMNNFLKKYLQVLTLHYRIVARYGINVQGGRSPNFNKCTVLNKHTGWKNTKFLINTQDGISTQCNFCQYIQN